MRVVPGLMVGHPSPLRFFKPGAYFSHNFTPDPLTASTINAGYHYAFPFFAPINLMIDRIGMNITAGAVGSHGKVAIYRDLLDYVGPWLKYQPGKLLFSSNEFDCSTSGAKEQTLDPPFLMAKGRLYWMASCFDVSPTVWTLSTSYNSFSSVLGFWTGAAADAYRAYYGLYANDTYALFPKDPFNASPSVLDGMAPPMVIFRIKL